MTNLFGQAPVSFSGPKIAKYVKSNSFPQDSGQFLLIYDLSPYLNKPGKVKNPEKTILDWILADTGPNFWHTKPFGVLSCSDGKLYVYHNAQVQQYISNVLDRFLDTSRKNEQFTIRLILVSSPDWRTKAAELIRPYPVKSADCLGWILPKSNRDRLLDLLTHRVDYIDLNKTRNTVPNGETFGWLYAAPERKYVADVQRTDTGTVTNTLGVHEGCRIEVTPLLSTDGTLIEVFARCQTTLLEKTHTFSLKLPGVLSLPTMELPQVIQAERKDKFSFSKTDVFLLDFGFLPIPIADDLRQETGPLVGLTRIAVPKSNYFQLLILIERSDLLAGVSVPSVSNENNTNNINNTNSVNNTSNTDNTNKTVNVNSVNNSNNASSTNKTNSVIPNENKTVNTPSGN